MPTIAVVAEILIVGAQAVVWLYLVGCLLAGWHWLKVDDALVSGNLATLVIITLAYTLGVLIDRLADSAVVTVERRFSRRPQAPTPYETMRLHVLASGGDLSEYLQYMRSRLRIARSTVLNLALSALALALLLQTRRDDGPPASILAVVLYACLFATIVTYWVAWRISETYDKRLTTAYTEVLGRRASVATNS